MSKSTCFLIGVIAVAVIDALRGRDADPLPLMIIAAYWIIRAIETTKPPATGQEGSK